MTSKAVACWLFWHTPPCGLPSIAKILALFQSGVIGDAMVLVYDGLRAVLAPSEAALVE